MSWKLNSAPFHVLFPTLCTQNFNYTSFEKYPWIICAINYAYYVLCTERLLIYITKVNVQKLAFITYTVFSVIKTDPTPEY
jgi:hypothetical protein